MALEIMRDDVKIIQGLSDYPNQEEGLTAGEMKAKFDEAAVKLQSFINNSVIPAVNDKLSASELSGAVSDAVEKTLGSITPDKIGAAPAGFGLNNDFVTVNNTAALDRCFTCGWVRFINNTTDDLLMGSRQAVIRIDSFSNSAGRELLTQTAYLFYGTAKNTIRRSCFDGTWSDWEWVNPPMTFGTEYRTTERYNGKPVYAQRIDFGAMPNTSSKMVFFTSSSNIDRALSVTGSSSIGDTIPYKSDASDISICVAKGVTSTQNYVLIKTSNDQSARTAEAVVKYTLI